MNVVGYEKHLAESSDLLTWKKLGKILTFSEDGWDKWQDDGGPDLMEPSEPWDDVYAHKPWMICYEGIVYHFYCAVGNQGRVIALATSKDLRPQKLSRE